MYVILVVLGRRRGGSVSVVSIDERLETVQDSGVFIGKWKVEEFLPET